MTERYADVNGKDAASHDEHGCFGVDTEYAHDVLVKDTCVGRDGSPAPRDDGITIRAFDHDSGFCPTTTRYLDASGSPAGDENGVYSIKDEDNAECDPVEAICRGAGGGETACAPERFAEERITYDKQGRVIDDQYSGGSGVDPNYGAPEIKMTYDRLGHKLTTSCFTGGARSQCSNLGYHREESHYDDNGRETDEVYFNEDDSPATNIDIFQTKYTYDNYDHLAEEQGFDSSGKLMNAHGMAVRRYYYDDGHRLFGLILLDTNNAPAHYEYCFSELTCPGETWHALRIIRSPTGHLLSNEFFDADGNLILSVDWRQQSCWGAD
jgi:hypothetical protein